MKLVQILLLIKLSNFVSTSDCVSNYRYIFQMTSTDLMSTDSTICRCRWNVMITPIGLDSTFIAVWLSEFLSAVHCINPRSPLLFLRTPCTTGVKASRHYLQGRLSPNNQGTIPLPTPPFPLPSPLSPPPNPPSPPLHSPPATKQPIWKQLRGQGERCKLPQWGLGRSRSQHRFWCILREKKLIWQQLLYGFLCT